MRHCVVLHQAVPDDAPPDERDVLDAAASVTHGLGASGWWATTLAIGTDLAAAEAALRACAPDLVFNLVESLNGADVLSVAAAALLERTGVPYTGSGLAALALTADKRATRRALRAAGIPVPPGPEDGWRGPFIAKPATAHASAGLGPHCVTARAPSCQPGWYAEAYVDGREFAVALLGDADGAVTVLPVAEMRFVEWPDGEARVLGYAAKWCPDTPAYRRTLRSFETVGGTLATRLAALARTCWDALGLSGYARVDLRLAADGVAYVIDVNANPCLSADAGFAAAAARAGLSHTALVGRIASGALPPRAPTPPATRRTPLATRLRHALEAKDDIGGLCRAAGFFSEPEIAIAEELAADRRSRGSASDYRFVLADDGDGLAGFACFGAVPATRDSWDLYWIVVHPRAQGGGIGRTLADAVCRIMQRAGGRRLYAETSARAQYAPTRAFYAATGFALAAVLPDFYAPGEAKQTWVRGV